MGASVALYGGEIGEAIAQTVQETGGTPSDSTAESGGSNWTTEHTSTNFLKK